ncbi:hypothetical protein EDD18DRAFT_1350422 [Armillaria luteobubalina]|uniref:Mid2 domain-containing protein n=1 Tax=Armillaria luteobubalina TaxID=153913 RepID=A0AA39UQX5_9AGAR|nr:hypothetical protein EDD18DRAFT_1350422 [Armillaria luteobubalina]
MAGYLNITYDNTETDFLEYVGNWDIDGSYTATNVDETGTLSSTKDQTANVTFIFPESANAFYYYGIRRCCGGWYAICIDCDFDSPTASFESIDAVNITDDGKNPPVVLYSKTFDTPGVHKIILTNQKDMRYTGGNSQLYLTSVSSTTSITTSSISAVSSIAPEAFQSPTSSSTSKRLIGAIVGGVVGGVAALLLCFIVWFFMRRRHHTQYNTQLGHSNTNTTFYTSLYRYSPFIVTRSNTHTPTADVISDGCTSRNRNRTSIAAGISVSNPLPGHTRISSSRMASSERLPRRETDAGRIDIDDDGSDLRTLPPEYEDIFSGGHLNNEQSVAGRLSRRLPTRPEPQSPLEGPPSGVLGQPSYQPTKF